MSPTSALPQRGPYTAYAQEVFRWGRAKPWDDLPRMRHDVEFGPQDVRTDGGGNILQIPNHRKLCFARPEVVFRHSHRTVTVRLKGGKEQEKLTRCGRCKMWAACRAVARERVLSDPDMHRTLSEFSASCRQGLGPGRFAYTGGLYGRLWQAFMQAVADRGPFADANDAFLAEDEKRRELLQREKWAADSKRHREDERKRRREAQQAPEQWFLDAVDRERIAREAALLAVAGRFDLPPVIRRIPRDKAHKTATLTAAAWAAATIFVESGRVPRPGTLARWLIERGLNMGDTYPTLKARLSADLERCKVLEQLPEGDPVWPAFDPHGIRTP
jgi:hypothetical protein